MSSESTKKIPHIIHNDLLTRHFKNSDPKTYTLLNRYFSFRKRQEEYQTTAICLSFIPPAFSYFFLVKEKGDVEKKQPVKYRELPKVFPKFIRNKPIIILWGIFAASSSVAASYAENRENKNFSDHNFTDRTEFDNEPIKSYRKIYLKEYQHRYNHLNNQVHRSRSKEFDFSTREWWPSDLEAFSKPSANITSTSDDRKPTKDDKTEKDQSQPAINVHVDNNIYADQQPSNLGYKESPRTQDDTKSFEEIWEERNKRGGSSYDSGITVKKKNNEYKSFEEIWAEHRK